MIELGPFEQDTARRLAAGRYGANRRGGTADRKIGPQSAEQTDLEGVGAEMAFCKWAGLWPDLEVGHRPDHDCVVRLTPPEVPGRVVRVDVKATRREAGRLLAARWKRGKPPDAYVLMVGTFPRYRVAGFAPAPELLRDENLTDLGHGPTYALPQARLLSWLGLLDILHCNAIKDGGGVIHG